MKDQTDQLGVLVDDDNKFPIKIGDKEYRILNSLSAKRQENEEFEEYKIRQKLMKELEKRKSKQRNYIHESANLIPYVTEDGKFLQNLQTKEVVFIGKTPGKTYIKPKE